MESLSIIIATIVGIIAIIKTIHVLYERYLKTPHKIGIDFGNVKLTKVYSTNKNINAKIALVCFDLKIINNTNKNLTLKDVYLEFYTDKESKAIQPHHLPKSEKETEYSFLLTNLKDFIFFKWKNIKSVIIERKVIPPGGLISGSALFISDISISSVNKINGVNLIVEDYWGNRTKHYNQILPTWFDDKGMFFIDAPLISSEKGVAWKGIEVRVRKSDNEIQIINTKN